MPERDNTCNWDDRVRLKDYLEAKIGAAERATEVARDEMNRRLEGMNEMRTQLNMQEAKFLTKEVFDTKLALVQTQVNDLRESRAETQGKASQTSVLVSLAVGVGGLILGGLGLALRFFGH